MAIIKKRKHPSNVQAPCIYCGVFHFLQGLKKHELHCAKWPRTPIWRVLNWTLRFQRTQNLKMFRFWRTSTTSRAIALASRILCGVRRHIFRTTEETVRFLRCQYDDSLTRSTRRPLHAGRLITVCNVRRPHTCSRYGNRRCDFRDAIIMT